MEKCIQKIYIVTCKSTYLKNIRIISCQLYEIVVTTVVSGKWSTMPF
jgi:hypothetical protein